MLIPWRRFYPELAESDFRELEKRANATTLEAAWENGVRVVRADTEISPGAAYFADFVHLTDLGSGRMAALRAATIQGPRSAGRPPLPDPHKSP